MVMGLVSGLALANYSDSGSFLVALSQDGLQQGGFWEVSRTDGPASSFDLSEFFQLAAACQLCVSYQDLLL